MSLRIVFMGTPDFATPALNELIAHGHNIVAVYTQAPKKSGRGMKVTKTPVHQAAEQHNIPVITPKNFKKSDDYEVLKSYNPDVLIVVAYGIILPKKVLDTPPLGAYNIHASLLPRWRGAAPIHRAIMAGDTHSGITIMKMDEGLDTGPIAIQEKCQITEEMTTQSLHNTLAKMGADLMIRALSALARGSLILTPQPQEGVTYADKINKSEARINWTTMPAQQIIRHINGLNPFPGAYCFVKQNQEEPETDKNRLKILSAALTPPHEKNIISLPFWDAERKIIFTSGGGVRPTCVQPAGKQAMNFDDYLNGVQNKAKLIFC